MISNKTITGVWNNIAGIRHDLNNMGINMEHVITKYIERGDDTMFWLDHWIGDEPLKSAFPGLYQLEKKKRCLIADRIQIGGPSWDLAPIR